MSKADVYEEIVKPMRAVFQAPSPAVQEAAAEEYASALWRFDKPELATAWANIRESHKARTWPPIALIVQACVTARTQKREANETSTYQRRQNSWNILRTTPIALQAASEGWAWPLKLHVLEHYTPPAGAVLEAMRGYALDRENRIRQCLATLTSPILKRTAVTGFAKVAGNEKRTRDEIEAAL